MVNLDTVSIVGPVSLSDWCYMDFVDLADIGIAGIVALSGVDLTAKDLLSMGLMSFMSLYKGDSAA